MKKIAVIGANGMLGSDLVTYLSRQFLVTPITKENYTSHIGLEFDVVINANGNSKRFWANQHILEDFELSTTSVYKSLFDFHYKKYIYISSSDVYENHSKPIYTKENQEIEPDRLSSYGFHKFLSEMIVSHHVKNYLILRSSMMLGKSLKKGPIYDILHNKSLFISKESKIQMITTKEVAKLIEFLLTKNISREIINIGGKGTVPFNKIQQFFSSQIIFSTDAETQVYNMNVAKLEKMYRIKTSKEYLQEYMNSLQSHS